MGGPALQAAGQAIGHSQKEDAGRELLDGAELVGADRDACAGERWMAHMLAGDFEGAWRESDGLRARRAPDPHRFWEGQDLRGQRVMLRCLHGFGDAVQMLRYLPRLRGMAAELIVEVPPRLVELASCFVGSEDVRVLTWGEGAPAEPPAWDVQMEVMELPYVFRTELRELPTATKYLVLPKEDRRRARACMPASEALRVGLVWAAGDWNRARSVPLACLEPLLETAGCEFWSLQGGETAGEWKHVADSGSSGKRRTLRDAAVCGDGILPLAAMISQMDVVITVDTLAAHLAGALGVRVWVLLQASADWRWMVERADSPWYPSMRLSRQTGAGDGAEDWESAIEEVARELRGLARGRTPVCLVG